MSQRVPPDTHHQQHTLPNASPLGWSRLQTELAFATMVLGASISGVIGPLLVPGFTIVAADLDVPISKITVSNGALVMALGVSAYFCNALARIYGTRLIFLLTTISLIATCCWGAASKSYISLLVARVFQGLGMGGWFALAGTTCINAMFSVTERGRRVGLWNFAVIVSVNIAPIISAQVIVNLSWRWAFWLLAIAFGLILGLTIVCFPETVLVQDATTTAEPDRDTVETHPDADSDEKATPYNTTTVPPSLSIGTTHQVLPTWARLLAIDSSSFGTPTQALQNFLTPLSLLINPVVIYGCLMWSVYFTWVIIQGAVADQIWTASPYNLSATAVGNLVGIAPLIGSALGCVLGGAMCDYSSKLMASRRGGTYEAEDRLLILIPAVIILVIGAFGLGESYQRGYSAIITAVFLAILNFAVGVGCTGIVAYTNDACGSRAGEAFGIAMVAKSAFAFGWTFALNDLYAERGPRVFFAIFGGLSVGVTMLTIPMYIFGRQIRERWSM